MYTYTHTKPYNPTIALDDAFPSRALARGCRACRHVQGLDTSDPIHPKPYTLNPKRILVRLGRFGVHMFVFWGFRLRFV